MACYGWRLRTLTVVGQTYNTKLYVPQIKYIWRKMRIRFLWDTWNECANTSMTQADLLIAAETDSRNVLLVATSGFLAQPVIGILWHHNTTDSIHQEKWKRSLLQHCIVNNTVLHSVTFSRQRLNTEGIEVFQGLHWKSDHVSVSSCVCVWIGASNHNF